jgi:hypothetical protein
MPSISNVQPCKTKVGIEKKSVTKRGRKVGCLRRRKEKKPKEGYTVPNKLEAYQKEKGKKKNGEEKEQQFSPLVYWIEHQHWTGNQDKLRSISKEANGNGRGELS